MEYIKKFHMICFSILELKQLYKNNLLNGAYIETQSQGYLLNDLKNNKSRMKDVVNNVISKKLKHKEEIEIFIALTSCVDFYSEDSKICFALKNTFDIKEQIKSIEDLKNAIKENTLTDFGIWKDGLRLFQLKQYRGKLDTDNLFEFIKEILRKYGNDLGDTNLLIQLQGPDGGRLHIEGKPKIVRSDIDYHKINQRINEMKLNFSGQILIKYNEENKFNVLNQVYPELKTTRRPIDQNYLAGQILYN